MAIHSNPPWQAPPRPSATRSFTEGSGAYRAPTIEPATRPAAIIDWIAPKRLLFYSTRSIYPNQVEIAGGRRRLQDHAFGQNKARAPSICWQCS